MVSWCSCARGFELITGWRGPKALAQLPWAEFNWPKGEWALSIHGSKGLFTLENSGHCDLGNGRELHVFWETLSGRRRPCGNGCGGWELAGEGGLRWIRRLGSYCRHGGRGQQEEGIRSTAWNWLGGNNLIRRKERRLICGEGISQNLREGKYGEVGRRELTIHITDWQDRKQVSLPQENHELNPRRLNFDGTPMRVVKAGTKGISCIVCAWHVWIGRFRRSNIFCNAELGSEVLKLDS